MVKGGNDSRHWYESHGHWTLAGAYGKFCTVPPTAHFISSPCQMSLFLPFSLKKRNLCDSWGSVYWFVLRCLFPSNLYIKNPLIPTFFNLHTVSFLSHVLLLYKLVVSK